MKQTTIQALLAKRLDELAISRRQAASKCNIPPSSFNYLLTPTIAHRPPAPDTLQRLSAGLGLPLDTLRHAAIRDLGYAE